MAVIDTHNVAPTAAQFGWTKRAIGSFWTAIKDWNDARVTRAELSKLTARQLDDIGLTADAIDLIGRR